MGKAQKRSSSRKTSRAKPVSVKASKIVKAKVSAVVAPSTSPAKGVVSPRKVTPKRTPGRKTVKPKKSKASKSSGKKSKPISKKAPKRSTKRVSKKK